MVHRGVEQNVAARLVEVPRRDRRAIHGERGGRLWGRLAGVPCPRGEANVVEVSLIRRGGGRRCATDVQRALVRGAVEERSEILRISEDAVVVHAKRAALERARYVHPFAGDDVRGPAVAGDVFVPSEELTPID